tara:strand:- start:1512 stop:1853 length:342 start_codon:yes stop_codon:yes gene_type:complete
MRYAKVTDNIVVHIANLEKDGFEAVEDSVSPGFVKASDGSFSAPPHSLENLLSNLRLKRDVLLKGSDWTGLADTALTNEVSAKWKLYRQKLRDLPKGLTTEFKIKNAVWPTKP